jgi:hypothetical protein
LFTFLLVLPIVDKLKGLFGWLIELAVHDGHYGGGKPQFIDWSMVPERAGLIITTAPLAIAAVIALTIVMAFSRSSNRRIASILGLIAIVLLFLTLKHFAIHYLMPLVAIAPVIVVWATSRFLPRTTLYVFGGVVVLLVGMASLHSLSSAFSNERQLHTKNEQSVNEVLARYQNPVVIGAFRSGFGPWAVQFGIAASNGRFGNLIPDATRDDNLFYNSNSRSLAAIGMGRVEWSDLGKFERAGRAILIVLPRGMKIDSQTAQTETLLDQGFGDTVERIIVTAGAR